jgi:cholest-4-en-3-one 26-monooxygenase
MTAGIDPLDLVDPARYARDGYPHAVWARLRGEAPVAYFAPFGSEPFWAITRHADIAHISRKPLRFSSAQGISLRPVHAVVKPVDMVVMLDPPRHGPMRRVATARFTPASVRAQRAEIERIAVEILDRETPVGVSREFDFVERAAPFPLAVIACFLGVPRDDWGLLQRWTNEVIGSNDPEFRRRGETPGQTAKRARRSPCRRGSSAGQSARARRPLEMGGWRNLPSRRDKPPDGDWSYSKYLECLDHDSRTGEVA